MMSSSWCSNGLITGCLRQTRQEIWVDKRKTNRSQIQYGNWKFEYSGPCNMTKAKPQRFRRSLDPEFKSLDRMSEEKGVLKEAEVEKVTVAKVTESKFSDPNHLK